MLLTRQFRYPAYVNGYDGLMIEAAAGLLDEADPEARIRAEVEEEIGYRLGAITKVFECFMSPGAVTEKLYLFVAEYEPDMKVGDGGGLAAEGEDIERLELSFTAALEMIRTGEIVDAKTIMLLQHLALHVMPGGHSKRPFHVMAGLVPAIHEHDGRWRSWVAGTPRFALQPAMT